MELSLIADMLDCRNHTDESLLKKEILYCYASDMMSDVLKSCKIGALLITGLVNQQVIHVAEIMDLKGIIFVSGKEPSADMIEKAKDIKLPIMTTKKQLFEACGILHVVGLKGGEILQDR
ncbi:MAG: DRTGG domain-containing protein [Ignavibacteria bacterium]|jgi:predicted transcriptional regulator|nr:DRTGG domain-containing protein [Ignavibacteria bacterium]